MMRLLSFATALLHLAATVTASPALARRTSNGKTPIGAAYVMNNKDEGNILLSHRIYYDGTVDLARVTATGGKGLHGRNIVTNGPLAADGLFSAKSILVYENFLFVCNAGSNTVTMFWIDPQNPTHLTPVGEPVDTGFEFPMSLAVSKQTGNLCVLNGGAQNGVLCYYVDEHDGLSPIKNTQRSIGAPQTTPPAGPPGAFSHLIFTDDGTKLVAAVKGDGTKTGLGYMVAWEVYEDGTLSTEAGRTTAPQGLPFESNVIEGTSLLINTDAGGGYTIYDYSEGTEAKNIQSYNVTGQLAICWSVYSRRTRTFFMTDLAAALVTEVHLDNNNGHVGKTVAQYPQVKGSATIDTALASIGETDFVYVLAPNTTSINVMSLTNGTGRATTIQRYNMSSEATSAGVLVDSTLQGMAAYIQPASCQ